MSDEELDPQEDMFSQDTSDDASSADAQRDKEQGTEEQGMPDPLSSVQPDESSDLSAEASEPSHGYDLPGYVLGSLNEDDTVRTKSALAANTSLRDEVQAFEFVVAGFAFLVHNQQINRGRSAGIRSRLIARAASARDGRPPSARYTTSPRDAQRVPIAESGALSTGRKQRSSRDSTSVRPPVNRPAATVAKSGPSLAELRGTGSSSTPSGSTPSETIRGTPAAGTTSSTGSRTQPVRHSGAIRGGVWLTLAVILSAIVGGIQEWRSRSSLNELRLSLAERDSTQTAQLRSLEASVSQKDSIIELLMGPDMRAVHMVAAGSRAPVVRVFWNQKSHEWTMRAYHLPKPRPGKTYQVWLTASTSAAPVSAGTFAPDAQGNAVMQTTYEMPKDALVSVAISEEPMGGMPVRTGPIVVAGK